MEICKYFIGGVAHGSMIRVFKESLPSMPFFLSLFGDLGGLLANGHLSEKDFGDSYPAACGAFYCALSVNNGTTFTGFGPFCAHF